MMTVFNVATHRPAAIAVSASAIGNAIGRARSSIVPAAQPSDKATVTHNAGSRAAAK